MYAPLHEMPTVLHLGCSLAPTPAAVTMTMLLLCSTDLALLTSILGSPILILSHAIVRA